MRRWIASSLRSSQGRVVVEVNTKVRISLFGKLGDAIGREVELPLPVGATVGEARRMLAERHPEAIAMLAEPQARACLDDQIVDDAAVVRAGADLAFLPPLSGG